jgi:hypothetical protein
MEEMNSDFMGLLIEEDLITNNIRQKVSKQE